MKIQLEHPIRHLMVDLDGTLLGNRMIPLSIDFARQALRTLSHYGGLRKAAKVLLAIQKEFARPSQDLTNDHRVLQIFSKRMGVELDEGRRILKEGLSLIFPSLHRHFHPLPGAKDFLDWAKDHYGITLATNPVWPREIVDLRVKWAGIDPVIFGSVTDITRMRACKPSAEYYTQILEDQGLKAEECILIGNDLRMDLPATRVGIPVFIVGKYTQAAPLKLKGAKARAWKGKFSDLRTALEAQD